MSEIRVIIKSVDSNPDPMPVPAFMTDPQRIAPCPCGRPPTEEAMFIEGTTLLTRWFHPECLDFLKYEMGGREFEELERWKRENEA